MRAYLIIISLLSLAACGKRDGSAAPVPEPIGPLPTENPQPVFSNLSQFSALVSVETLSPSFLSSSSTQWACSISPSLPDGLSLNAVDCRIEGLPTQTFAESNFLLTVSYPGGNLYKNIKIKIDPFSCTGDALTNAPFANSLHSTGSLKICTRAQLNQVRNYLDESFELAADIDLAAFAFAPIGSAGNPFVGSFDGRYYRIRNWSFQSPASDEIGLFKRTSGATVRRLKLTNVNVVGRAYVGGLVGFASNSSLSDISVSGSIVATWYSAGGIAGLASGSLQRSRASADVEAQLGTAGGLVGHLGGTLSNSYAFGWVTGDKTIGGAVGYNDGAVSRVLSAAVVSCNFFCGGLVGDRYDSNASVSASFWDIQRSGWATSVGGTGYGTLELYGSQPYESAGWDFIGTWDALTNDYPILQWE